MDHVPRITSATAIGRAQLPVAFENGAERACDCAPLLDRPQFPLLRKPAVFRAVRVDPGGCGILWNDEIDVSEYELWTNGKPVGTASKPPTAPSQQD